MSPDTERVRQWLQAKGSGTFTYRQIAAETGLPFSQVQVSCLFLLLRGDVDFYQRIGDYGTYRFELKETTCPRQ
jgi:hypothetical protein